LPAEWTALTDRDDDDREYTVSDEADRIILKGNVLTRVYVAEGEKLAFKILKSY